MLWDCFSFSCKDKRLHTPLTLIFCWGDAKLFLKDHREVALGTEAALISNLLCRYGRSSRAFHPSDL